MYYKLTLKDEELFDMIWSYLECRWFITNAVCLCSTVPQHELTVKFNQEIWDWLTEWEQQIIRFFFPNFWEDF